MRSERPLFPVTPAKGRPAKYYFAGTPKAGVQTASDPHHSANNKDWIPAFAGMTN